MARKVLGYVLYALCAGAVILASVRTGVVEEKPVETDISLKNKSLRCAIQLSNPKRHLPGLTTGYNYELLQRFARDMGDTLTGIVNARDGSVWLDSLRLGLVDIVVLPFEDSLRADSIRFSRPLDSLTVWAVREDCKSGLEEIDGWLESFQESPEHEPLRDLFLLRYSPAKRAEWGRRVSAISPYDSLVRAEAAALGWDWRLLCAIIYQESQFHIELRSRRGAEGLMQMMPSTAAKMGVTDLFDPEKSLKAGVTYLRRLQSMFQSKAADDDALRKFTLAAYNAGEGRLTDVINYASSIGADSGTWEGLVEVIPQMRDESTIQVDSVIKLRTFQGVETIAYVNRVLSLYEDFKTIHP